MAKESAGQRRERLKLCQAFGESGQTVTEFSRERGVPYWRVKSALKRTERGGGSSKFQEIPVSGGGEYTVLLRNGRELRIPVHFAEKRVRQLIEILETC